MKKMTKKFRGIIIGGVAAVVCVLLILLSVFTVLTGEVAIILGMMWCLSTMFFLKHFNNVNDMSGMFRSSKVSVLDLSDLDTSNVTNMSDIFRNSKATTLDLSYLDTSNATNKYDKLGEEDEI